MQTEDSTAKLQKYHSTRIASIVKDTEDYEEKEQEDEEPEDNAEYEKVQSPQGVMYPIALTLMCFIAPSVWFLPELIAIEQTHNS